MSTCAEGLAGSDRFDVVVCGGGIAGSTAAAALSRRGLRVLVCEAGLPNERRLAGELMHPPAARAFEELGLIGALKDAGAAKIRGFVVFRGPTDPGTVLSYSEVPGGWPFGIAIEHSTMARTLLREVGRLPTATVWEGARVLEAREGVDHDTVVVRWNGEEREVRAQLVVCADGRASSLREGARIQVEQSATFRMVGWRVPAGRLPRPGYGHVFTGGRSTTLAYPIADDVVRIMFELELSDELDVSDLLEDLPRPFRDDVERAMATEPRRTAKVMAMSPDAVARGRRVVVGDAGGCVHPLTATGIAFCTQDALRLAREVGDHLADGDHALRAALQRYSRGRRRPMRVRTTLGPAMVDALTSQSPEMRLLRHGLFRYWSTSPRGRRASLALLSTQEDRLAVMAREYASVCLHALTGIPQGIIAPSEVVPALAALLRRNATHLTGR